MGVKNVYTSSHLYILIVVRVYFRKCVCLLAHMSMVNVDNK